MNFCDEFMCSMGERHLLKDARKIPCGATYCLTCIRGKLSQRYSGKILDCPGCKSFHYVDDAAALPKDILFEMMFNDSFKCINNEAHEKLKKKVELLQDTNENLETCIDNYYDFIKDEMVIKVESMKMELDEILDKMHARIDEEKLKKKELMMLKMNENLKTVNSYLKEEISTKQGNEISEMNKERFYTCLQHLNRLEQFDMMSDLHKVKFEPCDKKLDESVIGKVTIEIKKNDEAKLSDTASGFSGASKTANAGMGWHQMFAGGSSLSEIIEKEENARLGASAISSSTGLNLCRDCSKFHNDADDDTLSSNDDDDDDDYLDMDDDSDTDDDDDEDKYYLVDNNRMTGFIKWFDINRGYGFITRKGKDTFCHASDFESRSPPESGDRVSFKLAHGPKGYKAMNVKYC